MKMIVAQVLDFTGLQAGPALTPSPICASHPSHSGGPRADVMRGGSDSTQMWSSIWRMSALCVLKAMMRNCPPQRGIPVETPRRCGQSASPTNNVPGTRVAPAGQARPRQELRCQSQVRPRV